MPYLYNFCFYFSLRYGSILVGLISLIQGAAKTIILGIGLNDVSKVISDVTYIRKQYNLVFVDPYFEIFLDDTEKYLTTFLIVAAIYTVSCVVMMYGAYTCMSMMLYPFIILEFLRFILLLFGHVVLMMVVKENVVNLGLLIGFTILGGFLLLGIFYCWFCVLNFLLVLVKLKKEIKIEESQEIKMKSQFYDKQMY